MLRVSNGKVIRLLSARSLRASRSRNTVAVLAIALTTLLFTALFTILSAISGAVQEESFRMAGGDTHGSFKNLTWEQVQQLREDPLIRESGARMFLGMARDVPFHKSQVEVSYMEPQEAPHYFVVPKEGSLPREGTDEAAADTRVLSLLGVEPEVGAKFTLPFYIDENTSHPKLVERTFTLCGWWEYDSAVTASHVLLPRSAAQEIAALSSGQEGTMTGSWNLDVMLDSSLHIAEDLQDILARHGYQSDVPGREDYIATGVNWGYSGAQFSSELDLGSLIAVIALMLLIAFTGYLIIYNVFQISVTSDVRFYGLLKTIGATGRQLGRIIRRQAFLLSLLGIPLGLALGFFVGKWLTPVILGSLDYRNASVSLHPWVFAGAALFALGTVFLSCLKPGHVAAKVSPVEAVRYTQARTGRTKPKRRAGRAGLASMAWANLGRSRGKTAVTLASLSLAVVLLTATDTFVKGFDMDKWLADRTVTDFVLGDAAYFQTGSGFGTGDEAVPEEIIAQVDGRGGIARSGRVYGQVSSVQELVSEDWCRRRLEQHNSPETADRFLELQERSPDGRVADGALLYGMEDFPLSRLNVIEGDLSPLSDPEAKAIAAVYRSDDYGDIMSGSHWAKVGDTVTLRYVEEFEYYYLDTGELIEDISRVADSASSRAYGVRAKTYREEEYTVAAAVEVPFPLSYRYYNSDQFVLGAGQFCRDTGTEAVMTYVFDMESDEARDSMEAFLADYTENIQPLYDYESRQTYARDFEEFRGMFLTMGGVLSLIIGLVGVLNFVNAVLTGILTRKREFAVLEAVGMTGRQLKTMLAWEGLCYTLLSLAASLVLSLTLGPLLGRAMNSVFWFFTYRLTLGPILLLFPVFALLGAFVPLAVYHWAGRLTIVERLRQTD